MGDQAVADVEADDFGGPVLEEAIGEAAGGEADVQGHPAGGIDGKGFKCGGEFMAPAAHVGVGGALFKGENGFRGEEFRGVAKRAIGEKDPSREDKPQGLSFIFGESALDQELIRPAFFLRGLHSWQLRMILAYHKPLFKIFTSPAQHFEKGDEDEGV